MRNNLQPNYGKISFPAFKISLGTLRVFQFSRQAAERFRLLHGFDATDMPAKMEAMDFDTVKTTFADLIWCGLSDNDRRVLSIEDARRLMTLSTMIGGLNQLMRTVAASGVQN